MKKIKFTTITAIAYLMLGIHHHSAANTIGLNVGVGVTSNLDAESMTQGLALMDADNPIKKKKKKKRRNPWMPVRLFEKGQWDARFAIGTVPTYMMDNAQILMLPVQVGMDYRITEHFSIGTTIGHSMSESQPRTVRDGVSASWTNNTTFLAIRPGVHITTLENWDFYGGFSIGANLINIRGNSILTKEQMLEYESHIGIKRDKTNAAFTGFTGFRRVVSHRLTVGGEVGFGISIFTVGAGYKISKSKTDPVLTSSTKKRGNSHAR